MTSLPIMFYSLFDFEYVKEKFMSKSHLYKIGMESACFGGRIFMYWLLYALVHGMLIYLFCLIAI